MSVFIYQISLTRNEPSFRGRNVSVIHLRGIMALLVSPIAMRCITPNCRRPRISFLRKHLEFSEAKASLPPCDLWVLVEDSPIMCTIVAIGTIAMAVLFVSSTPREEQSFSSKTTLGRFWDVVSKQIKWILQCANGGYRIYASPKVPWKRGQTLSSWVCWPGLRLLLFQNVSPQWVTLSAFIASSTAELWIVNTFATPFSIQQGSGSNSATDEYWFPLLRLVIFHHHLSLAHRRDVTTTPNGYELRDYRRSRNLRNLDRNDLKTLEK